MGAIPGSFAKSMDRNFKYITAYSEYSTSNFDYYSTSRSERKWYGMGHTCPEELLRRSEGSCCANYYKALLMKIWNYLRWIRL
jgi:hypothetical protein